MGRGLGSRQRAVMNAIDMLGGEASIIDVAECIEDGAVKIGGSVYESVRRAVQTLVHRGLLRAFEDRPQQATRYRVEYNDGSVGGHKKFGRPEIVAAHEERLKRYF